MLQNFETQYAYIMKKVLKNQLEYVYIYEN